VRVIVNGVPSVLYVKVAEFVVDVVISYLVVVDETVVVVPLYV
jgi:hypothetical protein